MLSDYLEEHPDDAKQIIQKLFLLLQLDMQQLKQEKWFSEKTLWAELTTW